MSLLCPNTFILCIIIIIYLVIFHNGNNNNTTTKPLSIHLMFIHCSVSRTVNLCYDYGYSDRRRRRHRCRCRLHKLHVSYMVWELCAVCESHTSEDSHSNAGGIQKREETKITWVQKLSKKKSIIERISVEQKRKRKRIKIKINRKRHFIK